MANYAPWWETTITIFNRFKDPQTDVVTWYKHIVKGAFWKNTRNKITISDVTIDSNTIICRIREDSDFKESYQWIELPNDEKSGFFTLKQGDIIVKGEVEDIIDEYIKGRRSSDLLTKYKTLQGCMEIESVGINTGTLRNEPHYYVSGV